MKEYGIIKRREINSKLDFHLEEMEIQGYTVLTGVLSEKELEQARFKLEKVYLQQELEFGKKRLEEINELDMARCLLAYDPFFLELIKKEIIVKFLKKVLGEYYILNLQNGILSRPNKEHHQSSWHRDLPYQDYVLSKPMAVNAYFCLDDYSTENGSTVILPFSHKFESMPSRQYVDKHELSTSLPAGSVIMFDAWLYHRAGYNSSDSVRRGINHLYTTPIIKQQVNLPALLNGKYKEDPLLNKILGYLYNEAFSVTDYRERMLNRQKNK